MLQSLPDDARYYSYLDNSIDVIPLPSWGDKD